MSHTLQTPWYNKTIKALQLAGKGDKTRESYARSVRQYLLLWFKILFYPCPAKTVAGI